MTSSTTPGGLARFNALEEHAAHAALREACASTAWVHPARPPPVHHPRRPLRRERRRHGRADRRGPGGGDGGHPPIGRPKPGDPTSSREQRGMAGASAELKEEMLELNLAYQERFGHVFLICATGRTGEQMRDAVKERICNSPEQEREIVRSELGKINRIRLARLVEEENV
ncbi:2-oxo-4-hydroxy-4-carboxy-5-ureidoimidazoline decarboxylase [Streptomyces mirabilis]|nr:2-oxo-4-hydroxy-4-carboxy-5-ureidoimidazoline decarboxylase [Streptomyces mirabilis]